MIRSHRGPVFSAALAVASAAWAADGPPSVQALSSETAAPRAERLEVFASAGYLGSPGASGSVVSSGVRLALARHLCAGFDLGYGLLAVGPATQDRWWLIPSVGLVLPTGALRLELGGGLGLGASSGYPSWSAYAAAPFTPSWAFQLAPAVRAHATVSYALTPRAGLLVRAEAASLLLQGNTLGFRAGNPGATVTDTSWFTLSLGVQLGIL